MLASAAMVFPFGRIPSNVRGSGISRSCVPPLIVHVIRPVVDTTLIYHTAFNRCAIIRSATFRGLWGNGSVSNQIGPLQWLPMEVLLMVAVGCLMDPWIVATIIRWELHNDIWIYELPLMGCLLMGAINNCCTLRIKLSHLLLQRNSAVRLMAEGKVADR